MSNIRNLTSHEDWSDAWHVLHGLRADLDREPFLESRVSLLDSGYCLCGAFVDENCVAVAGFGIYPHVTRGRDCWIHDLVTLKQYRGHGWGTALLEYIEQTARSHQCSRVVLRTRVDGTDAQQFYESRDGYRQTAYVYCKDLKGPAPDDLRSQGAPDPTGQTPSTF